MKCVQKVPFPLLILKCVSMGENVSQNNLGVMSFIVCVRRIREVLYGQVLIVQWRHRISVKRIPFMTLLAVNGFVPKVANVRMVKSEYCIALHFYIYLPIDSWLIDNHDGFTILIVA